MKRCGGFTLTELLIAAAASLILITLALAGLVQLEQLYRTSSQRLEREAELQRALSFIAKDIREGHSVSFTPPPLSGYQGWFQVTQPDRTIGYYLASAESRVWGGPYVIYRRDFTEGRAFALVDYIEANDAQGVCPQRGLSAVRRSGALIESTQTPPLFTLVRLCLIAKVPGSRSPIAATTEAAVRSRMP